MARAIRSARGAHKAARRRHGVEPALSQALFADARAAAAADAAATDAVAAAATERAYALVERMIVLHRPVGVGYALVSAAELAARLDALRERAGVDALRDVALARAEPALFWNVVVAVGGAAAVRAADGSAMRAYARTRPDVDWSHLDRRPSRRAP